MKTLFVGILTVFIVWIASSLIPTNSEIAVIREDLVELHERNDYQDETDQRIERKVDRVLNILINWNRECQ